MALGIQTLSSGTKQIPYLAMTDPGVACAAPVYASDFGRCRVPGGIDLWTRQGFYSPGVCFAGYSAACTQTRPPSDEWPLRVGETAVRCIPEAFKCNRQDRDQRFATSEAGGKVVSAPAFEVRWRSEDLKSMGQSGPQPGETATGLGRTTTDGKRMPTVTVTLSTMPDGPGHMSGSNTGAAQTKSTLSLSVGPGNGAANSGIEPGVVAGIAVGCALAALVMALSIVFVLRWRRRQRKGGRGTADNIGDQEPGLGQDGVAETDGAAQTERPPWLVIPGIGESDPVVAELEPQHAPPMELSAVSDGGGAGLSRPAGAGSGRGDGGGSATAEVFELAG